MLFDANVPVRLRAQQRAKYGSLQFTANYIAALRCLRHYIKLRITSHRGLKFSQSLTLFGIQNSKRMAFSVDRNHKFSERSFQLLQYSRQTSMLFGSQGRSDDKNGLDFPAFSL